jgi:P27 family predicted phage terminase small subunit
LSGPKPKPTRLRVIEGNPGKRALPKREPKPAPVRPPMPTYLHGEGRKHWTALAEKLERIGVLTEVDQDILGAYCDAYHRWREAEVHIRREGAVVTAPTSGYPMPNPWVSIRNRALDDMRRWAPELGIGAASRSRIEVKKPDGEDNPLADILKAANEEAAARRRKG